MKQTAVEWLFEILWNEPKDKLTWNAILIKAKEMEKREIIDAVNEAIERMDVLDNFRTLKSGEQYYNETYGK